MRVGLVRAIASSVVVSMVGVTATGHLVRASQPSYFDSSFGTNGVSTIELPLELSPSNFDDVQVDASGKILTLLTVETDTGVRAAIGRRSAELVVDTSFGSDGRTGFVDSNEPSMLLQTDGKILLAGIEGSDSGRKIALRRYRANGQIDQSFGTQGVATITELPGKDFRSGPLLAVVASTGRIIIAINVDNGSGSNSNFYFFALTEDGKRDYEWGYSGGREIVPRAGGVSAFSHLQNIAVLADGSLIGVGNAYSNGFGRQLVLVKLNDRGYLDSEFDGPTTPGNGGNGMVIVSLGSSTDAMMSAITLLSNGNIVVAGATGAYFFGPWSYGVAQFHSDGTFDSTFGTNGFFDTGVPMNDSNWVLPRRVLQTSSGHFVFSAEQGDDASVIRVNSTGVAFNNYAWTIRAARFKALHLAADGTIVLGGRFTGGDDEALIARMSSVGIPMTGQTGFRSEQHRLTRVNSEIVKSIPLSNGAIISLIDASIPGMFYEIQRPVVARILGNGIVDSDFGTGGFSRIFPPNDSIEYEAQDVAVQPDGKILVLVQVTDPDRNRSMAVWRLLPDGRMDFNFGLDGAVFVGMVGTNIWTGSLVLLENGQILLTGGVASEEDPPSWFFKFNASGSVDTTFKDGNNIDGRVKITFGTHDCLGCRAIRGPQGSVLVRGRANLPGQSGAVLARYLPDGTPDPSFSGDGFLTFPDDPFSIVWIADALVTTTGDIVAVAESLDPDRASVLIRVRSDGTLNTEFNSTGLKRYNLKSDADYAFTSSVVTSSTGYTVVGGIVETDDSQWLATFGRIGTTGEFDGTFGTQGISIVPSLGDVYLFHVASIDSTHQLASGKVRDANGNRNGILIRIGDSSNPPTTTVPNSTTSTTSTVPVTTSTVPTTTSTVPATASGATTTVPVVTVTQTPQMAFVLTLSQSAILKRMDISLPKGGKTTMSIAPVSKRVCKITRKNVTATAIGTCRVNVAVMVKGKKVITKTLAMRVS